MAPKSNGDTGLYDTFLAAYRTVQQGWDPGRVNSVVMFTDGDNDDIDGLTLPQLLEEPRKAVDPIQAIIIGVGASINQAPLEQITQVTGGGVFLAPDPARITEIFLRAIALRRNQ